MNEPKIRIMKNTSAPRKRQKDNAYPFTDAMAIEMMTLGMRIWTEFQKPTLRPSQ